MERLIEDNSWPESTVTEFQEVMRKFQQLKSKLTTQKNKKCKKLAIQDKVTASLMQRKMRNNSAELENEKIRMLRGKQKVNKITK